MRLSGRALVAASLAASVGLLTACPDPKMPSGPPPEYEDPPPPSWLHDAAAPDPSNDVPEETAPAS